MDKLKIYVLKIILLIKKKNQRTWKYYRLLLFGEFMDVIKWPIFLLL